ncbi:nitrous oxide reductase accessory protein NosL [Haloterrigena sp. SYSU A558-1]|uniref:Nitrous oxide reductase accessory protein NosL n=1 Tax=Haloterrigena gelatinilytica TaxID=2741724 RepID=A0A8J8GKK2_9EURY|nr:nitrous oxide reductase accessory protein NosL [Haloterrigena gelatinilytica]NUB91714.1 nitrous oxide reductase accessory protein NosL [Haloterrigena gelatinilytica]NUC72459.1 nitrous oxide reductase accessory protein NosL [Haloterrigena gelatinilytica]
MNGPNGRPLERRRLLGFLGTGLLAGSAGCLGGDEGEADEEDDERTVDPTLEHPGDEPVAFTDEQNCPICNMTPADYPNWHGQVAHEDGTGAAFDTPGCLFAYLVITTSDSPVAGAWIADYETGDLVDATEAHFALITDETAVDDPMKINPRSFADRDDAVAFLEAYDAEDLTEEDIIEFDEIDRETAEIYRSNRM